MKIQAFWIEKRSVWKLSWRVCVWLCIWVQELLRRAEDRAKMVEKTKGRKEEVVSREYTINLHKRLHSWYKTILFSFTPYKQSWTYIYTYTPDLSVNTWFRFCFLSEVLCIFVTPCDELGSAVSCIVGNFSIKWCVCCDLWRFILIFVKALNV